MLLCKQHGTFKEKMATRLRVLSAFKGLHRTCQFVFAGDREALAASRQKINSEFKGNKDKDDPQLIEEHLQLAEDTRRLLQQTIVQGKLTEDGSTYELRITADTKLEENTLFDPNADIPIKPRRKRKSKSAESSSVDCTP